MSQGGRLYPGLMPPHEFQDIKCQVSPDSEPYSTMAKASARPDTPASYEAAVEELEQLVARMESGQLALDDMLGAYQRGAVLLAYCRERLTSVENQVSLLEEGQPQPGHSD